MDWWHIRYGALGKCLQTQHNAYYTRGCRVFVSMHARVSTTGLAVCKHACVTTIIISLTCSVFECVQAHECDTVSQYVAEQQLWEG